MDKSRLVVNTLVYLDRLKSGTVQSELVKELGEMGISGVEVRREFLADADTELAAIGKAARRYGITLYYSVPSHLYENGVLMAERLEQFYIEAKAMGCHNVKLNIGSYTTVGKEDMQTINGLCKKYDVVQTVENDQTLENGRCAKIKAFLDQVHALGGQIGFTFDMGNWLWTGEDPHGSAHTLYPYTTYIHAKDVRPGATPASESLGKGCLPWQQLLRELPPNLPVALEYPCACTLPEELKTLLEAEY
ncbi:MAG: sugar phosphate isomerase/epimerase [Angelakisella sp.]